MPGSDDRGIVSDLTTLARGASQALARLDAERLEELTHICRSLRAGLNDCDAGERREFMRQAREAVGEMAVFARVLEATRANLEVMNRLRELRQGRLEYREAVAWPARMRLPGGGHGND